MYAIILALISLASDLIKRSKDSGELTPAEETALRSHATDVFGRYENAGPPPPPGVEP